MKPTLFTTYLDAASDHSVRIRLEGELDLATVPELNQLLQQQLEAGMHVLLDLSTLEFVDSSGLQAIVGSLRSSETLPGTLKISSSIPPQVHRLLEIAGLLSSLPLVDE